MSTSITRTRFGRLFIFGLLYFVQGAMLSYVLVFNNLYLRQFGASAGQLSLLNGLLLMPFILKIGFGLLSDKIELQRLRWLGRGHRVPYIGLGLWLVTIGSSTASFVQPVSQYGLFLCMALFIASGVALYDTTTDGLAIDVTPASEQAIVQGVMVLGRAMGLVTFSALYGRLIEAYGWGVVFWLVTALSLLPQPFLRLVQEPAERPLSQTFHWQAVKRLWRPEIGRFSLYAVVYSVTVYGANAIVTLFTNEGLGGTIVQVGDVAALAGLGMLVGAGIGVVIARWIPILRQGKWTAVIVSAALLLIAFTHTLNAIFTIIILWGFCLAASELVYVTLAMAKSDSRMGAGQFAIFMAISNVGTAIGQAVTTGLIDTVDFRWIFGTLAIANLLLLPILILMGKDETPPPAELSPMQPVSLNS